MISPVKKLAVVFVLCYSHAGTLAAHDQIPGADQRRPILIRNATIHPVDGQVMRKASILFRGGKIVALKKTIRATKAMRVIDGDGHHIYPGLIDSMTDLGLREISAVTESVDAVEIGRDNPNVRSWVAVNPDSELIPVARAGGILTAHVAPGGRFLQGQSAVLHLDGWTASEMSLQAPATLCINWEEITPRGGEDASLVEKRELKLKEIEGWFDRSERYAAAKQFARDSNRLDDFEIDLRLESLISVVSGQQPIFAKADRFAAIESAVAFARARSMRLIIYGGYDAEACASLLKTADVPVVVAATYRTPLRRGDPYDAAYTLPSRLEAAGVRFAISGEGPGYPGGASNLRNLPYHAACAVAYGLDPDVALRAVTLSAAEILGVDDRIGSLTVGKDATLIVADGNVLESDTNVVDAYIGGRQVDLGNRHETLFHKYRQKYQASKHSR
ncbi:MAG: amidohydrolase family protein [Planctomycetota bacterium]